MKLDDNMTVVISGKKFKGEVPDDLAEQFNIGKIEKPKADKSAKKEK